MKKILSSLLLTVLLAGCSSGGSKFDMFTSTSATQSNTVDGLYTVVLLVIAPVEPINYELSYEDFSAKHGDETKTPIGWVDYFTTSIINGVSTTTYVLKDYLEFKETDTKSPEAKLVFDNWFEDNLTDFSVYYNGTEIGVIPA